MSTLIMSWSKCKIEVGKTGSNDAMASTLSNLGTINDKSTSLSCEDGDVLEAKATGGVIVAHEESEHKYTLTTRIKEMDFATEHSLTGATLNSESTELTVKTNIVSDDYSVKLTPKNIGSVGLKIRKSRITFKPGYSEEEGHYTDVTFTILACADGELYKKFKVSSSDWPSASSSGS